ncbi:MAG: zinc-binding dehydrogenase [Gemmatimonadetes bacterium]|nr:zinc-binding dehydrogenase [Gemmatimonadota bacterium]
MLRRIGADHFFDYTTEDFTKSGQRYDLIFDMVARSSYAGCVATLNPKGRYVMANPCLWDMLRSAVTSSGPSASRASSRAWFRRGGQRG